MQAITKAELSFSAPDRSSPKAQSVELAGGGQKPPSVVTGNVTSGEKGPDGKGVKVRATLRARLGEDIYSSWFNALEFDEFDGTTVKVSVPVKFLRKWIESHYMDELLLCCKSEFKTAERVEVVLRQPGGGAARP